MKRMTIIITALVSIVLFPLMGNASLTTTGTLGFSWDTTGGVTQESIGGLDAYYEYDHRYTHGYADGSFNNEQYRGPGTSTYYQYYYFDNSGSGVGPIVNSSTSSTEANSSASSEWQLSSPGSTRYETRFTSGSGHIQSQAVADRKPENISDRAENYTKLSGTTFWFTLDPSNTNDWVVSLSLDLDSVIDGPAGDYVNKTEYTVKQYMWLYNSEYDVFSQSTALLDYYTHLSTTSEEFTFDFHINPFSSEFDYSDELGSDFDPIEGKFSLQFTAYSSAYEEGSPVPVPGAVWLLGSGLIGLVGTRKKLKK